MKAHARPQRSETPSSSKVHESKANPHGASMKPIPTLSSLFSVLHQEAYSVGYCVRWPLMQTKHLTLCNLVRRSENGAEKWRELQRRTDSGAG
jgi:hypothetical protein